MISESEYWKKDLQKNLVFFHEKLHQSHWRPASFVAFEKRVMISCYIIRKLAESHKITDDLFNTEVELYQYRSNGKPVDLLNRHELDKLYELEKPQQIKKNLSYVVNQVIHSFTFRFVFKDKNRIEGIAFNSDRSKKNSLYMVRIEELIEVMSPIAEFYISSMILEKTAEGEFVVVHKQ